MRRVMFAALPLVVATTALAHHAAVDVVDEDVYATIDEMVADTPHADLTFDAMPSEGTEMTVTTDVTELDALVDDGLLDELNSLSGNVEVTLVVTQRP